MPIEALLTTFLLGIGSAASPCLLPLYPGFLAYLAGSGEARGTTVGGHFVALLGLTVAFGVLTAVIAVALVVTALAVSLSALLAILVPVTTVALVALGLVMLAGRNPFGRIAAIRVPMVRHPLAQAYLYGLSLGPVAVPCAGGFLIALLGISLGLVDAAARVATFIVFGLGFCLPLIVLALVGAVRGQAIARAIAARHGVVLRVAGGMLIVAAFAEPIRLALP